MKYVCGFAAVNNGKHCIPSGLDHCVVCNIQRIKITVKFPPEPQPYNPKTYRLLSAKDMILYNPNLVSRRKRIISA